jgi:hypothetical protein
MPLRTKNERVWLWQHSAAQTNSSKSSSTSGSGFIRLDCVTSAMPSVDRNDHNSILAAVGDSTGGNAFSYALSSHIKGVIGLLWRSSD